MRWAVALLVGVLLALAAWSAWSPTPLPPESPPAIATGAVSTTPEAHARLAEPSTPRARAGDSTFWSEHLAEAVDGPETAADDDPTAVVLRGRLTVRQQPWIHPAGVEIRLTRAWLDTVVPFEPPDASGREPVTQTGPDGSFAFRFRPLAGELFFLIDRGGAWLDYQKVPRVPPTGNELDLGDVFVDERGGVRGRVVDDFGEPLAGVAVRAVDAMLLDVAGGLADLRATRTQGLEHFEPAGSTGWGALPHWVARRDLLLPFPTATSGRDGTFELRGLRPGAHDLVFRHTHGHQQRNAVQVAAPRTTEIGDVALRSAGHTTRRFVDEDGSPWVGASVAQLHDRLGYGTELSRTRSDGEAWFTTTEPAASRVLFCHAGGGPCLDLGYLADLPTTVHVRRIPNLSVSLVDPAGLPVAGAKVRFYVTGVQFRPVDRRLPDWMQPTERAPGTFVGRGFPGTVAVASAPGFAPAMAMLGMDSEPMCLVPLQWATVSVRDLDGRPIAGAAIRLQVHGHPNLTWRGAQWDLLADDRARVGSTDERGLLDIPVWGTWFSLEARHPDYAVSAGPRFVPQSGQTVAIVLHRNGGIVGTLTAQYRPVAGGFRVRARQRPPDGNPLDGSGFLAEHLAVTAADGTFGFRNLTAGIWELQPEFPGTPGVYGATRPASPFASHRVLLDDGQTTHCTLEASRLSLTTPQLAGIVRTNGAPTAGVLVRVRPLPPARARSERKRAATPVPSAPWLQQCTTDSFGDFDFAALEPGREYEVRFDLPQNGHLQFLMRRVVRTPPNPNEPPVQVPADFATGSLALQCSHLGDPFGNRMVRLRQVLEDGAEGACFEVLTNEFGALLAEGLPTGNWTTEAVHGGRLAPAEVVVGAGVTTNVLAEWQP